MLIWEAHNALALSLGDSIAIVPNVISTTALPDGVRYSKSLRDSYLYRAMLEIYRQTLAGVVSVPKQLKGGILQGIFPNQVLTDTVSAVNQTLDLRPMKFLERKPLYVFSVEIEDTENGLFYPLPVKSTYEAIALRNDRSDQKHDAFCVFRQETGSDGEMRMDYYDKASLTVDIKIMYLGYPRNPASLTPVEALDMEESFISKVIALATLYGFSDSQDIPDFQQFLGLQLQQ